MLWINTNGQIVGINAAWRESVFQAMTQPKENKEEKGIRIVHRIVRENFIEPPKEIVWNNVRKNSLDSVPPIKKKFIINLTTNKCQFHFLQIC